LFVSLYMKKLLPLFLFLSILAYSCTKTVNKDQIDQIDIYLQKATLFFENGQMDSTQHYLDICLNIDREYPSALYLQGRVYLYKDGIYNRRLSAQSLKQAVLLDKGNSEYHFSLATTYEKQGYVNKALNEYEKAAKYNPNDPRSYNKIAELNKRIGLRYDDKKFFRKSVEASRAAVNITKDPNSFYQQAAGYYNLAEYDSSIVVLLDGLGYCEIPRDSTALLMLLGACYVDYGDFEQAHGAFENARAMVSDVARNDMDDPQQLMTPQLYDEYLSYSFYKRKRMLRQFWGQLDPDPTTQANERKLEHYSRYIYSQITFSLPGKSVDGYKSRRGSIYMRYGPPSMKYYRLGEGLSSPRWIWVYNQFEEPIRFTFEDTFLNGDFDFPYPNKEWTADDYANSPSRIAAALADAVPQSFEYKAGSGLLEFSYMPLQFKGKRGKTDLMVFATIPYTELEFDRVGDKAYSTLVWRQVLRYPNWVFADSIETTTTYEIRASQKDNPNLSIGANLSLSAYPDSLIFAISIRDTSTNNIGIHTQGMKIKNFHTDSLMMSDIVLARRIEEPYDNKRHSRDEIKIITNLGNRYFTGEPIWLYYEIYNLFHGSDKMSSFTINQVIAKRRDKSIISLLKGALKGDNLFSITTSDKGGSIYEEENRIQQLDLSSFEQGLYTIQIEIIDDLTGQSTQVAADLVLYK